MESAAGYKILKSTLFFASLTDWRCWKELFKLLCGQPRSTKWSISFSSNPREVFCWVGVLFENNSQASILGTSSAYPLVDDAFFMRFSSSSHCLHCASYFICGVVRVFCYWWFLPCRTTSEQVHWRGFKTCKSTAQPSSQLEFSNCVFAIHVTLDTYLGGNADLVQVCHQKLDNFMHLSAPLLV